MTNRADMEALAACPDCEREPEPGWIETDNNGPIVPCPVCNRATKGETDDR